MWEHVVSQVLLERHQINDLFVAFMCLYTTFEFFSKLLREFVIFFIFGWF